MPSRPYSYCEVPAKTVAEASFYLYGQGNRMHLHQRWIFSIRRRLGRMDTFLSQTSCWRTKIWMQPVGHNSRWMQYVSLQVCPISMGSHLQIWQFRTWPLESPRILLLLGYASMDILRYFKQATFLTLRKSINSTNKQEPEAEHQLKKQGKQSNNSLKGTLPTRMCVFFEDIIAPLGCPSSSRVTEIHLHGG